MSRCGLWDHLYPPPPRPVSMPGAKSVCLRIRLNMIHDHPSVEEAASIPAPCGPECEGVHMIVHTEQGKFVVTGTPAPRLPLAQELFALYPPPPPKRSRRPPPRPTDDDAPVDALDRAQAEHTTPNQCVHGHALAGENLYRRRDGRGVQCRACMRAADRRPGRKRRHADRQRERRRERRRLNCPTANRLKTECWRGHPFDKANTYVRPDGRGRMCRACNRLTSQKQARKKRRNAA